MYKLRCDSDSSDIEFKPSKKDSRSLIYNAKRKEKVACGFQRGYSAVDNLFIIHSLFEILKFKKKKIFCAFIHFELMYWFYISYYQLSGIIPELNTRIK
jgi:hypothetical protein